MLDLHRLRLLREVDGQGTVHAAAAALGYSPSAVSQQLAVLEREVGTPVLERVGRNVRLTPAGQVLVRHAAHLLEGVEAAEAEVASVVAGRVAGLVRIASFQSALQLVVAPAVRALARTHPDVRVEATEAEVEQSAGALALNGVDVVVGDEYDGDPRPRHADLARRRLVREPMNVVLPAGHPEAGRRTLNLARLSGLAWAACQPGTGQHRMHLRLCRQLGRFEPDTRYTTDDFATLVELVRTAGAATLLPDLTLTRDTRGIVVRTVDAPSSGREIFVLTRRARTPVIDAVVAGLEVAAAELSRT